MDIAATGLHGSSCLFFCAKSRFPKNRRDGGRVQFIKQNQNKKMNLQWNIIIIIIIIIIYSMDIMQKISAIDQVAKMEGCKKKVLREKLHGFF